MRGGHAPTPAELGGVGGGDAVAAARQHDESAEEHGEVGGHRGAEPDAVEQRADGPSPPARGGQPLIGGIGRECKLHRERRRIRNLPHASSGRDAVVVDRCLWLRGFFCFGHGGGVPIQK